MSLTPTLNEFLRDFWQTKARYKVLYGGRASSKSWDAAGYLALLASAYPIRIVCARQFLNRSGDSIYALFKHQINRFRLSDKFDIQSTRITSKAGAEISFYGLWRNLEEIKSLHDIDVLLIEEGGNLTKDQFEILDPTFRKPGFCMIIIFNPTTKQSFPYQYFVVNKPINCVAQKINYLDNPYLNKEFIEQVIEPLKLDDDAYRHIYLGEPRSEEENAIIKLSWVMAAIDAHFKLGMLPEGGKRIGFDVADSGHDACCLVRAEGSIILSIDLWQAKEDELIQSATRAYHAALSLGATLIYDCIGVGAGVGAKIKELNELKKTNVEAVKFLAGGAARFPDAQYAQSGIKNKDFFSNVKAQAWWSLADRFRATYNAVNQIGDYSDEHLISISSNCLHLEKLIDELTTPLKSYDSSGRVKVESKDDLKKRGIESPNIADSLVMSMLTDHPRKAMPPQVKYQAHHEHNWMS